MQKEIVIKSLETEDLPRAAILEKCIFSEPWSFASLQDALLQPDNIYVAAKFHDTLIGYCGLWGVAGEGQIYNVAVAEEYRSLGIGRALLSALLRRGRAAGLTAFTLEVRQSNEAAIGLYESLGFVCVGVRKNFYRLPKEDAVIMWLRDTKDNQ